MVTPPKSNLSPLAEPWGRFVTDEIRNLRTQADRTGGTIDSTGRVNNSSLDVQAAQIQELYERQTQVVTTPSIATPPFNLASGTVTASTTFTLPPPSGTRNGQIVVSGTPTTTNSTNATLTYFSVMVNGTQIYRQTAVVPITPPPAPPNWTDVVINAFAGMTFYDGDPPTVTVTLFADAYNSTLRSVGLSNISASVTYGQRV